MTNNDYHKKNGYTYRYGTNAQRIDRNEFVKNIRKKLLEKRINKSLKFGNFQNKK